MPCGGSVTEAVPIHSVGVLRSIPRKKVEGMAEPWQLLLSESEHTCHILLAKEMTWSNQGAWHFLLCCFLRGRL